ncbi:MAG: hypothetical protein AAGD96_21005 [Chloroflexota bacterium]
MKKFNNNKTVLTTIGMITLLFGIVGGIRSGSFTEQVWIFILGITLIVIAYSLENQSK